MYGSYLFQTTIPRCNICWTVSPPILSGSFQRFDPWWINGGQVYASCPRHAINLQQIHTCIALNCVPVCLMCGYGITRTSALVSQRFLWEVRCMVDKWGQVHASCPTHAINLQPIHTRIALNCVPACLMCWYGITRTSTLVSIFPHLLPRRSLYRIILQCLRSETPNQNLIHLRSLPHKPDAVEE